MIKKQILVFLFRWLISATGMWFVINWFGSIDSNVHGDFWLYVVAGLVFSLVNSIVRPLATILSLPFIIVSMGIFTILINIGMMALTIWLLPGVHIDFWGSFFGTLVMSVINSLVNFLVPTRQAE
ncbi:phage holin family protein [Candidatus Saccharibacteria bacterium]|nr:phage holin family protein [Candidatus Saccharibacteria bacterium]